MKKKLQFSILSAAIFLVSNVTLAQNLITNGDFEIFDGAANPKFANWPRSSGAESDINNEVAVARVIGGATTLRLGSQNASGVNQTGISVDNTKTYRLSVTCRISATASDPGTGAAPTGVITISVVATTGSITGWTDITVNSNNVGTYTGNFTVSAASTVVRVILRKNTNIAYFDNVRLEDVSTLPIKLGSFKGSTENNGILLKWNTISEQDNDKFTLTRSTNGKDFIEIGSIKGAGNSTNLLEYSFLDKNPANGYNYYQLSQTDYNGVRETFNPIPVEFNLSSTKSDIKIYANQSITKLDLNWSYDDLATISILDLNGKTIFKENHKMVSGNNAINLNTSDLFKTNVYILTIRSGKQTLTNKFYITQ